MIKKLAIVRNYDQLISNIGQLIELGRKRAVGAVNTVLVQTYWLIGKYIVEYEQEGKKRAEYGGELLVRLSKDLSHRYGRGFSVDNLELMRKFYQTFPLKEKSETASRKFILSWSHYCLLISIGEDLKRSFYEIEAVNNQWSVRELKRQADSLLYERLALSKNKKKVRALAKKGQIIERPEDAIKDPYVLEFLDLKEEPFYSESQLEQKLIDHLQEFLLEMGKGFCFIARQKRITINNQHYYLDLILYNRILKALVLIDLKVGPFAHADAGQMNFYLNYFKKNEKLEDESDPIGLILCTERDKVFVEYVLGGLSNKIFTSKYRLALPKESEIKKEIELQRRLFGE